LGPPCNAEEVVLTIAPGNNILAVPELYLKIYRRGENSRNSVTTRVWRSEVRTAANQGETLDIERRAVRSIDIDIHRSIKEDRAQRNRRLRMAGECCKPTGGGPRSFGSIQERTT
jgi:hypothetical protein